MFDRIHNSTQIRNGTNLQFAILAFLLTLGTSFAQGIPEPGLVLYGVIRNLDGRAPARMTAGPLVCRVTPPSGSPISITTNLQDINGQFSYVLTIPFESDIGVGLSANTLSMPEASANYTVAFFLANAHARAVATRTLTFSRADRARQQRIDADFLASFPDANGNGLPDWWETLYFGGTTDPNADSDHDGLSNLSEYLAGTNPTNRLSSLAFVNVLNNQTGIVVEWSSITNRTYTLLRSTNLLTGFFPLQTNLIATPPKNSFQDATTTETSACFYRVQLE